MKVLDFIHEYDSCAINHVPSDQVIQILDAVPAALGAHGEANHARNCMQRNAEREAHLRFANGAFAGFSLHNEYTCFGFWDVQRVVQFEDLDLDFESDDEDLSALFELC